MIASENVHLGLLKTPFRSGNIGFPVKLYVSTYVGTANMPAASPVVVKMRSFRCRCVDRVISTWITTIGATTTYGRSAFTFEPAARPARAAAVYSHPDSRVSSQRTKAMKEDVTNSARTF